MKECPNCGELNGDQNVNCFKCNTPLKSVRTTKRICPKCMQVYFDSELESCPTCHTTLRDYESVSTSSYDYSNSGGYSEVPMWEYIIAVLLPGIGIIMGLIYLARGEDDIAKRIIMVSIIVCVVCGIIYGLFLSAI